jgi:hypothetical protein
MEQLGFHWTDFHGSFSVYYETLEKFQVALKSDKITGTLLEDQSTFMIISCNSILRVENVRDKVVQKIKTQILYLFIYFFRKLSSMR